MRWLVFLALLAFLSGCTTAPETQPLGETNASGNPGTGPTGSAPASTTTTFVQDTVLFTGTLGASACFYNGSGVSCSNVGGSNVLRYLHDRKGNLTGGNLTISFSPATGTGPTVHVSVAEGCPDSCRNVQDLGGAGPDMMSPPVGTGGAYNLRLPAATILDNQTLSVRIAPILITALASASPVYDIRVEGTLDFAIGA